MSNVHVNRTLMGLSTAGLVEVRAGNLTATDWEKPVEVAEFDLSYLHLRQSHRSGGVPPCVKPGCRIRLGTNQTVSEFSCLGRAVAPVQAMARVKRSPKRMAN